LGDLNLSHGGTYNPQFALRLGAGFGSQVAMTLVRRIPGVGPRIDSNRYKQWLAAVSGDENAELEVVKRTLHIKSQGVPLHEPARSTWTYGQGPSQWASSPVVIPAQYAEAQPQMTVQPVKPVELPGQEPGRALTPVVQSSEDAEIKAYVLKVISEKTGYPEEMLDPDLDLEADLGIDTVKQAELFAEIRTHYGIPRREDLILANYNTLSKVVGFVKDNLADNSAGEAPLPAQPVAQPEPQKTETSGESTTTVQMASGDEEEIKAYVLQSVSEKTGYPVEMLDLDLDLEADLGIDTVKQAELFATIRSHYGIPRREDLILANYNTLARVITFMRDSIHSSAEEPAPTASAENANPVLPREEESMPDLIEEAGSNSLIPTRVPVPVLLPRLDLCPPSSITLSGSRVW